MTYEATSTLFADSIAAIKTIEIAQVDAAVATIAACSDVGRQIWLAGNGGSAATASHLAGDLAKWGSPAGGTGTRDVSE